MLGAVNQGQNISLLPAAEAFHGMTLNTPRNQTGLQAVGGLLGGAIQQGLGGMMGGMMGGGGGGGGMAGMDVGMGIGGGMQNFGTSGLGGMTGLDETGLGLNALGGGVMGSGSW